MQQCLRAFEVMSERDEYELRDKALFVLRMLTGARDGAVASMRLKHISLEERHVFQDGRDVHTKNAKTIDTWFFPVNPVFHECFSRWVRHLKEVRFFGPEDALFPKVEVKNIDGTFVRSGLSREPYSTAAKLNQIIRGAFRAVQMPEYTPHSFRKTLAKHGDETCPNMETLKAWSMNFGHDHLATTINSHIPVSRGRQAELSEAPRGSVKSG